MRLSTHLHAICMKEWWKKGVDPMKFACVIYDMIFLQIATIKYLIALRISQTFPGPHSIFQLYILKPPYSNHRGAQINTKESKLHVQDQGQSTYFKCNINLTGRQRLHHNSPPLLLPHRQPLRAAAQQSPLRRRRQRHRHLAPLHDHLPLRLRHAVVPGMNCIKIGFPGKLILSKRKGSSGSHILLKTVSDNQFSGKTYFYTIHPRQNHLAMAHSRSRSSPPGSSSATVGPSDRPSAPESMMERAKESLVSVKVQRRPRLHLLCVWQSHSQVACRGGEETPGRTPAST